MGNFNTNPKNVMTTRTFSLLITNYSSILIYDNYFVQIENDIYDNYIIENKGILTDITFDNLLVNNVGINKFTLYGYNTGIENFQNIMEGNILVTPICYLKNTKILCYVDGEEKYIKIQDIKKNTLIKTYKDGYKQISHLAWCKFKNSSDMDIKKTYKLFKLSKQNNSELFEDLYVSGQHSILVDDIKKHTKPGFRQKKITKIKDKYLINACNCKHFEEIDDDEEYELFHIVIDNEQYGIWANGILSESLSLKTFNSCFRLKEY